jgi:hypothetical protein
MEMEMDCVTSSANLNLNAMNFAFLCSNTSKWNFLIASPIHLELKIRSRCKRRDYHCAVDDDDVVNLVCELLKIFCEMGDDAGDDEITDVLLKTLPESRKMSMRRSLFTRLPLIDVILSRQVLSNGFHAKSQLSRLGVCW